MTDLHQGSQFWDNPVLTDPKIHMCPGCGRRPKPEYLERVNGSGIKFWHSALDCMAIFYWHDGKLIDNVIIERLGAQAMLNLIASGKEVEGE